MTKTLLSIGHGYSAQAFARILLPLGWRIIGTTRDATGVQALRDSGIEPLVWPSADLSSAISQADCILSSVAPNGDGDPVLNAYGAELRAAAPTLSWVGYLSTTGVYGDHKGGWVSEETPLSPSTTRGVYRRDAEAAWAQLGLPLHIFRLAGIYGPGRGPFAKVRAGTARRIIKKNQLFSRIHVEDIAQVLAASIANPNAGAVYNVCDDNPAPPQDVLGYAAQLLGVDMPVAEDFETAEMTPMARSFYAESKSVSNDRIKSELGVTLLYPDYKTGLKALLNAGE
ncbi:NAD(P)-dependent oxidoreductase [Amylibacter marinus]|uniref:NAD(P)-dependent oxidoreductase n=1 Tax=Amylibacter marinus TaxID=1475483 RepID=A0ABQ5VVY7_9RHOB|nr:SDR family oxidoreductase [Amylibacter marinus]GLQ35448.1 NAD(P)-dependent oxidoreductase [Amylibacter marinus]